MSIVEFAQKPIHEIVGDDESVIDNAKELARHLEIDIFSTPLKELPFYKEYLRYFDVYGIVLQKPLFSETFDMDLLIKLIAASHSSTYDFELDEDGLRLAIQVSIETRSVKKYLDELDFLQIARMYSIYLNEMISLENLQYENDVEKSILIAQRKENLKRFYQKKQKALKMEFYSFLQRGQ